MNTSLKKREVKLKALYIFKKNRSIPFEMVYFLVTGVLISLIGTDRFFLYVFLKNIFPHFDKNQTEIPHNHRNFNQINTKYPENHLN